jgi:hypothetical protein
MKFIFGNWYWSSINWRSNIVSCWCNITFLDMYIIQSIIVGNIFTKNKFKNIDLEKIIYNHMLTKSLFSLWVTCL